MQRIPSRINAFGGGGNIRVGIVDCMISRTMSTLVREFRNSLTNVHRKQIRKQDNVKAG